MAEMFPGNYKTNTAQSVKSVTGAPYEQELQNLSLSQLSDPINGAIQKMTLNSNSQLQSSRIKHHSHGNTSTLENHAQQVLKSHTHQPLVNYCTPEPLIASYIINKNLVSARKNSNTNETTGSLRTPNLDVASATGQSDKLQL